MTNFDLELITDNLVITNKEFGKDYLAEALSILRSSYSKEDYKKIQERLKEKLGV